MQQCSVKLLIVILSVISVSCNSIDINSAEEYIDKSKKYNCIDIVHNIDSKLSINYMVVNTDKDELTPKLLDSINMTKLELDAFIIIVRSTNAVIIDRNRDGQFYFIAKGFLDDNNGILYSPFELEKKDIFDGNDRIHFTDNYIFRWEHIKGNWYKAYGGN